MVSCARFSFLSCSPHAPHVTCHHATCPGARYHIELSRQLADFLATPLSRCGGLLSLPDVYCLFNRARGTELVSPDDLLQVRGACVGAGPCGNGRAFRMYLTHK